MLRIPSIFGFVVSAAAVFATPTLARAGLDACNNINVSADAQCKVMVQGGCETQCTPVHFDVACSAKLETTCQGQCNVAAQADCSASCETDCESKCNVTPAQVDCHGDCTARCDGGCQAKCASSGNQSQCEASCKTCCGSHCDGSCTGTAPSADCKTKCQGSCSGSCTAKANVDCQIQCQSSGYAQCEGELSGGCKTQCQQPSGALFCDGNYVDTGNNLKNCIDALNAYLKAHVDVSASGSASSQCDGGTCSADAQGQAQVKSSCAAAPGDAPLSGGAMLAGLGVVGLAMARRKRRG